MISEGLKINTTLNELNLNSGIYNILKLKIYIYKVDDMIIDNR